VQPGLSSSELDRVIRLAEDPPFRVPDRGWPLTSPRYVIGCESPGHAVGLCRQQRLHQSVQALDHDGWWSASVTLRARHFLSLRPLSGLLGQHPEHPSVPGHDEGRGTSLPDRLLQFVAHEPAGYECTGVVGPNRPEPPPVKRTALARRSPTERPDRARCVSRGYLDAAPETSMSSGRRRTPAPHLDGGLVGSDQSPA